MSRETSRQSLLGQITKTEIAICGPCALSRKREVPCSTRFALVIVVSLPQKAQVHGNSSPMLAPSAIHLARLSWLRDTICPFYFDSQDAGGPILYAFAVRLW